LDLYQAQKRPNLIMLIVLLLTITSVNALAILLEAFFNIFFADTHTETRRPLLCMCARAMMPQDLLSPHTHK